MVDKSQPVKGIAHRPVADAQSSSTGTTNRCAAQKAEGSEPVVSASRDSNPVPTKSEPTQQSHQVPRPKEHGGQKGLEPTRYGDWEKNGRCTDF